jgi:nicotinate-nucleotide--dimethylbenzimidazole phosphoribosyltransferase
MKSSVQEKMGIGNTTTSSAILTAFSGLPAEKTVGRGAGASDETFAKKKNIVGAGHCCITSRT